MSASVTIDSFHVLWRQYDSVRDIEGGACLVEDSSSRPLRVLMPLAVNGLEGSICALQKRVVLLLESPSASMPEIKGAFKLVRIFRQNLRGKDSLQLPEKEKQNVDSLFSELTVSEIRLVQKMVDVDPKQRSFLQLGFDYGCLPLVLDQVKGSLRQLRAYDRSLLKSILFCLCAKMDEEQDISTLHALLLDEELRDNVYTSLAENTDEVVITVLRSLTVLAQQVPEKLPLIIKSYFFLATREISPAVAECIYDTCKMWSHHIDPDKECAPDTTISSYIAAMCSQKKQIFRFFLRDKEEESSDSVCQSFLSLPRMKTLFAAAQKEEYPVHFNVVEMGMWMHVPPEQMADILTQEQFENEWVKISHKIHPDLSERYILSCWSLDRRHLEEKYAEPPKGIPKGISVDMLLEVYDQLNPDQEGRCIVDGHTVRISKQGLQLLVQRIKTKEAFDGTPRAQTNGLEDFYTLVETHICHALKLYQEQNDRGKWASFLEEISLAALGCGGGYFATALTEYNKAAGSGNSPKERILKELAELRAEWFQQTIGMHIRGEHTKNHFNRALKKHGGTYGIPGAYAAQMFEDKYGIPISTEVFERSFGATYTIREIAHWLLSQGGTREEKDLFIDYYRKKMPLGWQKEVYSKLQNEVEKLMGSKEESSAQKIHDFLAAHEIERAPHQTPAEAIREAQFHSFLTNYAHDAKGSFRLFPLLHILSDLRVITPTFREENFLFCEESSLPIWVQFIQEFFRALGMLK